MKVLLMSWIFFIVVALTEAVNDRNLRSQFKNGQLQTNVASVSKPAKISVAEPIKIYGCGATSLVVSATQKGKKIVAKVLSQKDIEEEYKAIEKLSKLGAFLGRSMFARYANHNICRVQKADVFFQDGQKNEFQEKVQAFKDEKLKNKQEKESLKAVVEDINQRLWADPERLSVPGVAMEFAPSLGVDHKLDPWQFAKCMADVLKAVVFLEKHHAAWMDIKFENVGIRKDGTCILIDAGALTVFSGGEKKKELPSSNPYWAPEFCAFTSCSPYGTWEEVKNYDPWTVAVVWSGSRSDQPKELDYSDHKQRDSLLDTVIKLVNEKFPGFKKNIHTRRIRDIYLKKMLDKKITENNSADEVEVSREILKLLDDLARLQEQIKKKKTEERLNTRDKMPPEEYAKLKNKLFPLKYFTPEAKASCEKTLEGLWQSEPGSRWSAKRALKEMTKKKGGCISVDMLRHKHTAMNIARNIQKHA